MAKDATQLALALGYLTPSEVLAIKKLARDCEDYRPLFVNIGAGGGTSALAMREARPKSVIYSVDSSPGGPFGGLEGERNAFDDAMQEYPNQILGDSGAVAAEWRFGKIDFLFVDDGHHRLDVERDIDSWLPHMCKGGVIAFHDYGRKAWPDVRAVVDEKMAAYECILYIDTIKAFRIEK